jgi:hypothetical protein
MATKVTHQPNLAEIEYSVSIREDGAEVGFTSATIALAEAQKVLAKLKYAYPESQIVWRQNGGKAWQNADDDLLKVHEYGRTVAVLASIVASGLPLMSWSIRDFAPNQLEGSVVGAREEDRAVIDAYATFLGVEANERVEPDYTRMEASATLCGVQVTVSAYIRKVDAERAKAAEKADHVEVSA